MEEELIEMELKEVKAIEPDKILEDGSFEDFVSQEEKMEHLLFTLDNRPVMLVEKGGTREILAMVRTDTAVLLQLAGEDPEQTEDSLAYRMIQTFCQLGLTQEKVVVWDEKDCVLQTKLYMRKADGTPFDMELQLEDGLLVSMLAGIPFYVNRKLLQGFEYKGISRKDVGAELLLLEMMTDRMLEKEMEEAIRTENYEYAGLVKRVQDARKQEAEGN